VPGTYVYEVSEVAGADAAYTYDRSVYTVTYEVTQDGGALACARTITRSGVRADAVSFDNAYAAPAATAQTYAATPLTGDATPLAGLASLATVGLAAGRARPAPQTREEPLVTPSGRDDTSRPFFVDLIYRGTSHTDGFSPHDLEGASVVSGSNVSVWLRRDALGRCQTIPRSLPKSTRTPSLREREVLGASFFGRYLSYA